MCWHGLQLPGQWQDSGLGDASGSLKIGRIQARERRRRRRSAAAMVLPTEPTRLIRAVPCTIGDPVTGDSKMSWL